jgi:hypothetical protein
LVPNIAPVVQFDVFGHPVSRTVPVSTNLAYSTAPVIVVTGFSQQSLGEWTVTPVIVVPTLDLSAPIAAPVSHAVSSRAAASQPTRAAAATSRPVPAPPPVALPATRVAVIPQAPHVEIVTAVDSSHSTITVMVPISPATRAVGVTIRTPSGDDPDGAAIVAQLVVKDRDGSAVAAVGPLWDPQADGPPEAVSVALDSAPAGGQLEVQIAAGDGANPTAISTAASNSSAMTMPLIVDVQREDAGALSGTGQTFAGGQVFGTLLFGAQGVPVASPVAWTQSTPTQQHGDPQGLATLAALKLPGDEPSSVDGAAGASTDGPVVTGPLASRSAGAIGPALATVIAELAPPVDRHERALAQALDDLAAPESEIAAAVPLDSRPVAPDASDAQQDEPGGLERADGTLAATARLGAFPLKVTAIGGHDRGASAQALLGTLPGSFAPADAPKMLADDASAPLVALALAAPAPSAPRAFPDRMTQTCMLVVGLGLLAGPLVPELLSLVPSGAPRWRRGLPARRIPRRAVPAPSRPERAIRDWLRGPFASRLPVAVQ